jgi:hypothetical protein
MVFPKSLDNLCRTTWRLTIFTAEYAEFAELFCGFLCVLSGLCGENFDFEKTMYRDEERCPYGYDVNKDGSLPNGRAHLSPFISVHQGE